MAVISRGIPTDDGHALLALIGDIAELLDQLRTSSPDTYTITDDNGVVRLQMGRQDDGSYGLRIYTADPEDPDHLKHNLTAG